MSSEPAYPPSLHRALGQGERVVVALRRHWFVVAKPVGIALAALAVVITLGFMAPHNVGPVVEVLWWVVFGVLLYAAFYVVQWRREWWVVTDKRLLKIHGMINRTTDMVPIGQLRDMAYKRTFWGKILGYGEFIIDRSRKGPLGAVTFVPRPSETYHAIIAEVLGLAVKTEPVTDDDVPETDDAPWDDDPTARLAMTAEANAGHWVDESPVHELHHIDERPPLLHRLLGYAVPRPQETHTSSSVDTGATATNPLHEVDRSRRRTHGHDLPDPDLNPIRRRRSPHPDDDGEYLYRGR